MSSERAGVSGAAGSNGGVVVGPHPLTAEAGAAMLRLGGNAFDAAVAAAFTEAVVEPCHNGIAGYGGCIVAWDAARDRPFSIDYNTIAPARTRPDMYPVEPVGPGAYRIPGGVHKWGASSVGVPGIVAGLERLHSGRGRLAWSSLLEPAVNAARSGFAVNQATHQGLRDALRAVSESFPITARLVCPDGRPPEPGELLSNPGLAELLEHLAANGAREFYEGPIAREISQGLTDAGGLVSDEDLAGYRAVEEEPLRLSYRGIELLTPRLAAGGLTSLQVLALSERFSLDPAEPVEFFHHLIELLKPCWRLRLLEFGDRTSSGRWESDALDPAVLDSLEREVRAGLSSPEPGVRIGPDPANCTSHVCAADAEGNVVSLTQTHGGHLGSRFTIDRLGLTFGHGMCRFDPRPGLPNSIAPGKRPLHNMAPILAVRDGTPLAAFGTPGGRTIVNNQAYFAMSLFRFGIGLDQTLGAPRLHVEEAEPAKLEKRAGTEILQQLRRLGHQVEPTLKNGGPAHGLLRRSDGSWEGATDPRGEGAVREFRPDSSA